ncbi:hypothetical protein DFH06DRAFT_1227167 [Mycena polygramma]|nr:hypothetical protein DFH06DRAFT_1227167 [Mycena polygramma]
MTLSRLRAYLPRAPLLSNHVRRVRTESSGYSARPPSAYFSSTEWSSCADIWVEMSMRQWRGTGHKTSPVPQSACMAHVEAKRWTYLYLHPVHDAVCSPCLGQPTRPEARLCARLLGDGSRAPCVRPAFVSHNSPSRREFNRQHTLRGDAPCTSHPLRDCKLCIWALVCVVHAALASHAHCSRQTRHCTPRSGLGVRRIPVLRPRSRSLGAPYSSVPGEPPARCLSLWALH